VGWVIVAVIAVVVVEIAFWKEALSGRAATWRFYLWALFTLYAGVFAAYGYWGWHTQSDKETEVTFAAVMVVLGALAALFVDRAGIKAIRIVKDIIATNRGST